MKKQKLLELPPVKDFLHTVPDAARMLHVCPRTVQRMVKNGEMESCIVGKRCRRIRDSVVQKHMGKINPDEQGATRKAPSQISFLVSS